MIASVGLKKENSKLSMTLRIDQKRALQPLHSETIETRIKIWLDVLRNFERHRGRVYHTPVLPAADYGSKAVRWMSQVKDLQ